MEGGSNTKLKIGDRVFIKATVSDVPREGENMYRLITDEEGSVVWCSLDELIKRMKGEQV